MDKYISLMSWTQNKVLLINLLLQILSKCKCKHATLDTTITSSQEQCEQIALLDKLMKHLDVAKKFHEITLTLSQEVQNVLTSLFELQQKLLSSTSDSFRTIFRLNSLFSPILKPPDLTNLKRKSCDDEDDQCRDGESRCNSSKSNSSVVENDGGSEKLSSISEGVPTYDCSWMTDSIGDSLSDFDQMLEDVLGDGTDRPLDESDVMARPGLAAFNTNDHIGQNEKRTISQEECPSQQASSFLKILKCIRGNIDPALIDALPPTNSSTSLSDFISARRSNYTEMARTKNFLGMVLEMQLTVIAYQSSCVSLRCELTPDSQGQSDVKLSILEQIEGLLSENHYKFDTIFEGIGFRVYILKKCLERQHPGNSEDHSWEFVDILTFIIEAMMAADNFRPEKNITIRDLGCDFSTIFAEYQSLTQDNKLLYQLVGFMLIQFVFGDACGAVTVRCQEKVRHCLFLFMCCGNLIHFIPVGFS